LLATRTRERRFVVGTRADERAAKVAARSPALVQARRERLEFMPTNRARRQKNGTAQATRELMKAEDAWPRAVPSSTWHAKPTLVGLLTFRLGRSERHWLGMPCGLDRGPRPFSPGATDPVGDRVTRQWVGDGGALVTPDYSGGAVPELHRVPCLPVESKDPAGHQRPDPS